MSVLDGLDHEQLVIRRGDRSDATLIVAIHSTALGPALGGARLWHYPRISDAVADALRLSSAMTLKAAAAGLGLGGGKAVLALPRRRPPSEAQREAILLDFGELVESLDGAYITAEDVGTRARDMVTIATRTRHVVGLPAEAGGSGDPSPVTALGVAAAIRACVAHRFGRSRLDRTRVAVAGLGAVGSHLARMLAAEGCELVASDIDPTRREFAEAIGADWVEPARLVESECDVFAPCALGGMIDRAALDSLRCEIICGAANNVLAEEDLAGELEARGILYAPDFIANVGGLISVYGELRGYPRERAKELARGIEGVMSEILLTARRRGTTPLEAAAELATARLRGPAVALSGNGRPRTAAAPTTASALR